MLNFDQEKVFNEHQNGVDIIGETRAIVSAAAERGYENVFFIGIGGTEFYARQMLHIVKQLGSRLPLYVENAADFCLEGNPNFTKDSLVFFETISGDTQELAAAIEQAKQAGALITGYVEKKDSLLYRLCDHAVVTTGGAYYYWYTVTLTLIHKRQEFPEYQRFFEEIKTMPENIVSVYRQADAKAKEYADRYCDEPLQYLVGSGNLEDWAHCYGMCIMEEMQWMRTRTVSAANFFHGTLEVIERDIPVMLIKGEDVTRPLMERVENFVHKISAKVTVFDSRDFVLKGISQEFRGLVAPIVMRSAFQRISAHLEYNRRHPLPIRRYYRRLDY